MGIDLEKLGLEAYRKECEQEYVKRHYTLVDSALCREMDSLHKKDQYKRPADSLQLAYFREGSLRLKQLAQERGGWLTRYLTRESNHTGMVVHYPVADMHYFLSSYIIPDCEQGYTSWDEAYHVVSFFQRDIGYLCVDVPEEYPREQGRGYYGMYGVALDEAGKIDFEQSYMGMLMASGLMRWGNTTYLQATTNFTSQHYLDELERLRQFYISQGIPPDLIKVVEEKNKLKAQSDNDPVTYVVFRVEGDNVMDLGTNPIFFD